VQLSRSGYHLNHWSKNPPPLTAAKVVRATRNMILTRIFSAITSFLEPEVLERFSSAPVELRGHLVLTAPRRKIALCDPSGRAMAY
jgi:hypothetical protein